MAKWSARVNKAFADISEGDYYVDSDGHWLTLREDWNYMGGRIVHEHTARGMLAARRLVEHETVRTSLSEISGGTN